MNLCRPTECAILQHTVYYPLLNSKQEYLPCFVMGDIYIFVSQDYYTKHQPLSYLQDIQFEITIILYNCQIILNYSGEFYFV